jgi:uncharacterized protein YbjT (DUF2867 family)
MSRILITGGRGILGREIVARLKNTEHRVRVMSRRAAQPDTQVEWAQADFESGSGVPEALQAVDIIVHCASDPLKTQQVDVAGTKRLLEQAHAARVKHLIYISIVGIDRIPSFPYYKTKLAVEQIIQESSVPYSILRATQFNTLPDIFLSPLKRGFWSPVLLLHPESQFQLIDAGEVADYLLPHITEKAVGRIPDVGGPEVLRLRQIAKMWLEAQGLRRPLLFLPAPLAFREGFRKGYNTIPENPYGRITWADYLRRVYGAREQAVSNRQPAV